MRVVSNIHFQTSASCLLEVEISRDDVKDTWEEVLRRILPSIAIPGFRPGKAPRAIVEKRYAASIREEVERRLIDGSLSKALESHQVEVARCTLVNVDEVRHDQPFRYSANLEVWPKIEKLVWRGLRLKRMIYLVTEAQVDVVLEKLRLGHATLVPCESDHLVGGEDVVEIEYEVSSQGSDTARMERLEIDLSQRTEVRERLYAHFAGRKLGDTVEWNEGSEGETAPIWRRGIITGVFRKQLPELNEDFVKSVSEVASVADLRTTIRAELEQSAQRRADSDLRRAALEALVSANEPINPPPTVVREQAWREANRQLVRAGIPAEVAGRHLREKGKDLIEQLIPAVEQDLKAMRLLDCLAAEEGLIASEAEIDGELKGQSLSDEGRPGRATLALAWSEAYRSRVKQAIERRKAVEAVIREATIVEEPREFVIADV